MNEPDKIKEILTSGMKITEAMCDAAVTKEIANQFKREIGFVNLSALKKSEKCDELEVVGEGIGFAHFHHRRDGQTTIYEIAVRKES